MESVGFEPTTSRLQNERSSYVELRPLSTLVGLEPTTSGLEGHCSTY
jgi:hypothetical protein